MDETLPGKGKSTKPDGREARLAKALRANLRRRKAQARERQDSQSPDRPSAEVSEASVPEPLSARRPKS